MMMSQKAPLIEIMDEAHEICNNQRSGVTDKLTHLEALRLKFHHRDVLEALAFALITTTAELHFARKRLNAEDENA